MARLILERAEGAPARSGSEGAARAGRALPLAEPRRPVRSVLPPAVSGTPGPPGEKRRR